MIIPSNTKSDCYSYQWDDKPKLFSWSLEKEYYHIECRIEAWHRRANQVQQEKIRNLYRCFADLYLKYIQRQALTEGELAELAEGIEHKSSTVWIKNASYIEELAYYEPFFKEVIQRLCQHKAYQQRERGLIMINGAFNKDEKITTFSNALTDKSAAVRARAVNRIWDYRYKELLPLLEEMRQSETNKQVLEAIKFARFYIDKPKGDSITFTWEEMAAYKEFE
jgi:hypothetical protein